MGSPPCEFVDKLGGMSRIASCCQVVNDASIAEFFEPGMNPGFDDVERVSGRDCGNDRGEPRQETSVIELPARNALLAFDVDGPQLAVGAASLHLCRIYAQRVGAFLQAQRRSHCFGISAGRRSGVFSLGYGVCGQFSDLTTGVRGEDLPFTIIHGLHTFPPATIRRLLQIYA